MTKSAIKPLTLFLLVSLLAACSRVGYERGFFNANQPPAQTVGFGSQDQTSTQTTPLAPLPQNASSVGTTALSETGVDYINATAYAAMSVKDKSEAASAQFFALQTGRPGAPRNWSGTNGTTGSVTVGPFKIVEGQECRTFTHTVKVSGVEYDKSGTSCRAGGKWQTIA